MTDVHLGTELSNRGTSVECRDLGDRIEATYNPADTTEVEALVVVLLTYPRLVSGGYRVLHPAAGR